MLQFLVSCFFWYGMTHPDEPKDGKDGDDLPEWAGELMMPLIDNVLSFLPGVLVRPCASACVIWACGTEGSS